MPSVRVIDTTYRDTAATPEHSGGYVVVRDAAIGLAAGAITGATYASILVHRPGVTDHSEDGFAYIGFSVFGGLAGMLIGAFVGILQTK